MITPSFLFWFLIYCNHILDYSWLAAIYYFWKGLYMKGNHQYKGIHCSSSQSFLFFLDSILLTICLWVVFSKSNICLHLHFHHLSLAHLSSWSTVSYQAYHLPVIQLLICIICLLILQDCAKHKFTTSQAWTCVRICEGNYMIVLCNFCWIFDYVSVDLVRLL